MSAWIRYRPSSQRPWNVQRVVHLHRRVIFGATWGEVEHDLAGTPEDAVNRVLNGDARRHGVPDDFEELSRLIGDAAVQQTNPERLQAAWIYRLLFSPDPLAERLTFMWHNHFATSNQKVTNLLQMKQQNDLLRRHARGSFCDLLTAILRDPAMLLWLDAPTNRRSHPNENLGRELLELFTLGIGHYSEPDVKDAARALTGLTVKQGKFAFDEARHDADPKSILGETRSFDADSLANLLLAHPATSRRLARRLVSEFFGEDVVSKDAEEELAELLRSSDLSISQVVETILHSELFFSAANIGSRVSDPLTHLIAPLRALEQLESPPSTLALASWLKRMGLGLFYPPNVAGWPGGRQWLSTQTVVARTNYAVAVAEGATHRPSSSPRWQQLQSQAGAGKGTKTLETLLLGISPDDQSMVQADLTAEACVKVMTDPRIHRH